MNPPCRECERKGCGTYHSECELYQAFLVENEKEKEVRKKIKEDKYNHREWKKELPKNNVFRSHKR